MQLIKWDEINNKIIACKDIYEMKLIGAELSAIKKYVQDTKQGLQVKNTVALHILRLDRKIGKWLEENITHGTINNLKQFTEGNQELPSVKLKDVGISKKESSQLQKIYHIPQKIFNEYTDKVINSETELTKSSMLKLATRLNGNGKHTNEKSDEMCVVEDLYELIKAGKVFKTIYADPPWAYSNQSTRSATDTQYKTMSINEICDLPVSQLSDNVCHLHLWTTNSFLRDAFNVIDAWGFEYKSCFVWVKPKLGIGNYWRVSHEFLLLGVKGKCTFLDKSMKSWEQLNRTKHSEKPEQIRTKIEAVSPSPYLELFARRTAKGWISWGNEIRRDLFNESAFSNSTDNKN